jgi:chemotaxis protein MotB
VVPKVKKAVVELESIGRQSISVLIEGHTDDDRFSASGPIADIGIYLLKGLPR